MRTDKELGQDPFFNYLLRSNIKLIVILVITFFVSPIQSNAEINAPPGVEEWSSWIQPRLSELGCAQRGQKRICIWESSLNLSLSGDGASLTYQIQMDKDGLAPLLGDDTVSIDTLYVQEEDGELQLKPVIWSKGAAWVHLPRGRAKVSVKLTWSIRPDVLKVPAELSLIEIVENGKRRTWVDRDQQGAVWLKSRERFAKEREVESSDRATVRIFRVWRDDIPLSLETIIQLNVSGKARDLVLKNVLPEGAKVTQLATSLSSEWVGEGLRVYLNPGQVEINIHAVLDQSPNAIIVPHVQGGEVAPEEVWVWHRKESLRTVKLSGLEEIDPDLTPLPSQLSRGTYTWIAPPNATLSINELKRGMSHLREDELNLERTLWMDLDGEGYVFRDSFWGQLKTGTRLNFRTAGVIGRASQVQDGEEQPLLITTDPVNGNEGVEIRADQLRLTVDGRYPHARDEVVAMDWTLPVNILNFKLNLPPGWHLFAVEGAGQCPQAWLQSWDMIDIFFVALITIGFVRLFGRRWGIVTLTCLTLYHNAQGPSSAEWIILLIAIFLLKTAYEHGRFMRLTLFCLVCVGLSFTSTVLESSQTDLKTALHPQLELEGKTHRFDSSYQDSIDDGRAIMSTYDKRDYQSMRKSAVKDRYDLSSQLQQLDQNAVVQTGPGIPEWNWRSHLLNFYGPIKPGHGIRLYLISPLWSRFIHLLRVLALLGLCCVMGRFVRDQMALKPKVLLWLLCVGALPFANSQTSHAQTIEDLQQEVVQTNEPLFQQQAPIQVTPLREQAGSEDSTRSTHLHRILPTAELLDEWVKRIKREQGCVGECIYISSMSLVVENTKVNLTVKVHAERDTVLTLPGVHSTLHWLEASIEGEALPHRLEAVGEGHEFATQLRIPQGVHSIHAQGELADLTSIQLRLFDQPRQLNLHLVGWSEDVSRAGKVTSLIQLSRTGSSSPRSGEQSKEGSRRITVDVSWYTVTRELTLGPTWQMVTLVSRARADQAAEVIIPTFPAERVLSSDHEASPQGVRLGFASGVNELRYLSEFTPTEQLTFTAPSGVRWSETWTVHCGVIWSCQYEGLNPISYGNAGQPTSFTWKPWPSEAATINVKRPKGVPGSDSTIEKVNYTFTSGINLAQGKLEIRLNASRGGEHFVVLPKQAETITLKVEDLETSVTDSKNRVRLPVKPGVNKYTIQWKQEWIRSFKESIPVVEFDLPVVNLTQQFNVGYRWILWTHGPEWGPAILFWGALFLSILIGSFLGRGGWSPLSSFGWCALLSGVAQHDGMVWLLVICWFIVFALRSKIHSKIRSSILFNFMQISLAGYSIIFFSVLVFVLQFNLLQNADMQVSGAQSSNSILYWYSDRVSGSTPEAGFYSLSSWIWRGAMLVWSLWLANSLLSWVKWAWNNLGEGGGWRPLFETQAPSSAPDSQEGQDP